MREGNGAGAGTSDKEGQERGKRGPQGAENKIRKHHRQNNLRMIVVVMVG
jgi:hypothetical protein